MSKHRPLSPSRTTPVRAGGRWLRGLLAIAALAAAGTAVARTAPLFADGKVMTGFTATADGSKKVAQGTPMTLTITVTSKVTRTALVDLEIYSNATRSYQQVWDNVEFKAGTPKKLTATWNVPSDAPIGYRMAKIGVFGAGWSTFQYWNDGAMKFLVTRGSAADLASPTTTTIPTTTTLVPATPVPTTAGATTTVPTTTIAPVTTTTMVPVTTTTVASTTTTTTVPVTTTTAAPAATTTVAPPTTLAASPATNTDPPLWWEDFRTAGSLDRLVKEVHAGDPTNFVPTQFHGDHNQNCEGPTTGRALTEDHTVGTHFWWCAPGGDATKGHFMTGINTTGYVIISFAPKDDATGAAQVFPPSANRICWDQNLTDLGGRKWNQLMVISEATFLANGQTISYLNPGNPDNFSATNPQARPSGDDFTIKFLKHSLETFRGQSKVYDNFFVALNGVTDKAARYRNCVTDNGNGTITRTQDRPGGTRSETTFPGAFPAGNRVFILGDDNYNVLKSYEEGAIQYVSDPFTWHWDNLEIS
jgi:hypothetical protein